MPAQDALQARVNALLRDADARLEARTRTREELMTQMQGKTESFECLALELMSNTIRPRLEVLANAFPHAGPIVQLAGGHGIAVPFSHTDDFPAHARVEVNLTHDTPCECARCTFSPSIIPILIDYERDIFLDVSMESPDPRLVETFLDERVERFVASYLSLREPGSPYQKGFLVTDPVCGMTFRRVDAQSTIDIEGRRVFFCAEVCRKRFESAPDRYGVRSAPSGAR